jgi:hypothetical protein
MANDLVKFPDLGDSWEDVDGPGMYVLAVLLRRDEPDHCAVGAGITVMRPKGKLLTPAGPIWPTSQSRDYDTGLIEAAAGLFEEKGERAKATVMRAQVPESDLSVQVLQATQMGSTARTIRSTKTGDHWQAEWSDLTPAGILHLHQINTCFMRSPLLLTFLGDDD